MTITITIIIIIIIISRAAPVARALPRGPPESWETCFTYLITHSLYTRCIYNHLYLRRQLLGPTSGMVVNSICDDHFV